MTDSAPAMEQQPFLWHGGQPISPEGATARRVELMADADYVKAALGGDRDKSKELADLLMLSRGVQPRAEFAVPRAPQSAADVTAQMSAKEAEREQQRAATWRNLVAPETEQEVAEFERGEATKSQKEAARRNIARAISDRNFGAKILRGDMDARRQWDRWNWVAHAARETEG